ETDRRELLRKIAEEDPRTPRGPNKAIPAELETIVEKAMSKDAADRYATAQDLADDLRRYLDDKPISARPPRLKERAVKWARRHKPVVRTGAVFVVIAGALASAFAYDRFERGIRIAAQVTDALDAAVLHSGEARGKQSDLAAWDAAIGLAERA